MKDESAIEMEIVDETRSELAVFNALTEPTQLTEKQAIALLNERYKGIPIDCSTTAGDKTARVWRSELVSIRTSGDKKRLELNRKALEENKKRNDAFVRIKGVVEELEKPFDDGIKAEEDRKKAIQAEKDRIKAEAQKVLDDKISAIGQLPLKIIGKDSGEIEIFLSTLEAREFGAEFTGDTLARAQAAKQTAVDAIRQALADTKETEEKAAQVETERVEREAREAEERKIEAARLEAEKIEREKREAEEREIKRIEDEKQRAEFERQQAELNEQKRLADIELEKRLAELAEQKRIQDEIQKAIDNDRAKIDADLKRLANEEAARQADAEAAALEVIEQPTIEVVKQTVNSITPETDLLRAGTSFLVEVLRHSQLSAEEQREYRCEEDHYLRVSHNGVVEIFESDGLEPEDVSFFRDLAWIPDALGKCYAFGLADSAKQSTPLNNDSEEAWPV
jgi:hypothetical protein